MTFIVLWWVIGLWETYIEIYSIKVCEIISLNGIQVQRIQGQILTLTEIRF